MVRVPLIAFLALAFASVSPAADEPKKPAPLPPTIAVAPFTGQSTPGMPIRLSGSEFELLTISGYTGKVTWDVTSPDGTAAAVVRWFQCKPKATVVGYRAGQTTPAEYETPETPSVVVYALGTGRAVIAAWGVSADGQPVKIAQLLVDSNRGPLPPPGPNPPLPPGPDGPADAALVARFRDALSKDTPGLTDARKHAAALAGVYLTTAGVIPAAAGQTWGDLYSLAFDAAVRAGVPRRPALSAVREIVDAEIAYDAQSPLTAALRSEIAAKFRRLGLALQEAAK